MAKEKKEKPQLGKYEKSDFAIKDIFDEAIQVFLKSQRRKKVNSCLTNRFLM